MVRNIAKQLQNNFLTYFSHFQKITLDELISDHQEITTIHQQTSNGFQLTTTKHQLTTTNIKLTILLCYCAGLVKM